MAAGDLANSSAMSMDIVPDTSTTDDAARVRWGAREINKTRDYIATLLGSLATYIGVLPVANGGTGGSTKATARVNIGVSSGTVLPSATDTLYQNGDIFFVIPS